MRHRHPRTALPQSGPPWGCRRADSRSPEAGPRDPTNSCTGPLVGNKWELVHHSKQQQKLPSAWKRPFPKTHTRFPSPTGAPGGRSPAPDCDGGCDAPSCPEGAGSPAPALPPPRPGGSSGTGPAPPAGRRAQRPGGGFPLHLPAGVSELTPLVQEDAARKKPELPDPDGHVTQRPPLRVRPPVRAPSTPSTARVAPSTCRPVEDSAGAVLAGPFLGEQPSFKGLWSLPRCIHGGGGTAFGAPGLVPET